MERNLKFETSLQRWKYIEIFPYVKTDGWIWKFETLIYHQTNNKVNLCTMSQIFTNCLSYDLGLNDMCILSHWNQ